MWKGVFTLKIAMIFLALMVLSFGNSLVFILVGLVILLGGCFMAFRQGQGYGHEACSVKNSAEHILADPDKARHLDPKMYKQMYSVSAGVKAVFAGGIIGYVINSVYIIITLLVKTETGVVWGARLASMLVSLPYWPVIHHWHDTFTGLAPDMVIMLMAGPFLVPLCQFAGYLQGPKLWARTEKAMAEGKRRAKARSRIVRKKKGAPRSQRPEI